MARIRTIKPEFPQSETVGKLSREARLLFIQLWTICDDSGRTRAASRMLASLLYPYDDDARDQIPTWLGELDKAGCIRLYDVEGNRYLDIPKWLDHQKIDRPSASKFPAFDEGSRVFDEPSRTFAQDQGREGTKERTKEGEAEAAAPARVVAIASERLPDPADVAFDHYRSKSLEQGWPDAQFMTSTRRFRLHAILKICGGIDGWVAALNAATLAGFLRLSDGRWQPWFNLDWLLDEQKFTRLMEGIYDEHHSPTAKQSGLSSSLAVLAAVGGDGDDR